jgi:2'-5' RNA ligase/predicted nucleotidyltransferase
VSTEAEDVFNGLADQLKADKSVIGYFLSGSRGKGFNTPDSDFDVVIIAHDRAGTEVRERYPFRYHPEVDCTVHTLDEFRSYAAFGSSSGWDRYSFAHLSVEFDRSGELQKLVDEKGRLPESDRERLLREALDAYINSTYRSMKRTARGEYLGARLEAVQSIPHLLDLVFALEGRHAPFPGYLEQELENYPLTRLPFPPKKLVEMIGSILGAVVDAQQETLRLLESIRRDEGLGDVIGAWGDDYHWMLSFSPTARAPRLERTGGNETRLEYVVAVFLSLPDTHWVEDLRGRFDPLAGKLPAHTTLVHPFASRMSCDDLQHHISEAATGFTSFKVELQGITGHQDEYLFLNLLTGNDEVVALREKLYQGELSEHRDRSRTFIPHVTVGRLSERHQFLQALRSTSAFTQLATVLVEEIVAYRIDADGRRVVVARARLGT